VDDLLALSLVRCEINWDAIRGQATGGDYATRGTALRGIESVLPGECAVLRDKAASRDSYWSLRTLVRSDTFQNINDAAVHLSSKVRLSVSSWASLHERLLMTLSGGLDSSIVLSCLSRAPSKPVVTSVNFFDLAAADERTYARSMAQRAGSELVEQEFDRSPDLKMFLGCARTASPVLHFTAIDMEPTCIRLAQERGATGIVYGELGDDILGHCIGPEILADSIWRSSYRRPTRRAIADYAQVKRVSIWQALAHIRRWRAMRARHPFWSVHVYSKEFFAVTNKEKLVTDELLQEYERTLHRFIHPWLQDVAEIPPGWLQLICGLITATSTWSQSPFAGGNEAMFLRPLASQPLLEAYARIPAALHIAGGQGGAVARLGFKDALTKEVLSRGAAKGTPEMWLMEVMERNRAFLKEFLLDGVLVGHRILDERKVETAITSGIASSKIAVAELITQLYIEAWVRQWQSVDVRAAA
jgi:asparagine synthase (glutamine-hydrolysing)